MDVPYVEDGDPLQRLDLYLPPGDGCDPVPVVVWVHGGGWRVGDKRNNIGDKVALWHSAGWAVASVNYRLTDVDVPEAERVVAPAHNEDVAAALAWLVDQAPSIGLDPNRLALLGHSAGAAIAAAVSVDPAYLGQRDLSPSAVACSAPLDTEGFDIASAVGGPEVLLGGVYREAFGADPARWTDLSPITHVGEAPVPPLFLVTRGTPGRRAIVTAFADAAEAAGGRVTVVDLPGFTHEDVNDRIGAPDDDVLTPSLQIFLTDCLDG
jgi:acetyl esterase/lipase